MNRSYLNILFSLPVAVVIALLSYVHTFTPLNERIYYYLAYPPVYMEGPLQTLLIEVPADVAAKSGEAVWPDLLNMLNKAGARQIIFNFLPPGASKEFYCLAMRQNNVIFARFYERDGSGSPEALQALPENARECLPAMAVTAVPPVSGGLHTEQYRIFRINGFSYPSLETLAAQKLSKEKPHAPGDLFRLSFIAHTNWLPRIRLKEVLQGDFNGKPVARRSVLISLQDTPPRQGFYTPLNLDGSPPLSFGEYQALALHTLLSGQSVQTLSFGGTLILLFLQVMVSYYLSRSGKVRLGYLTLFVVTGLVFAVWLCYQSAGILLPFTELLIAQLILLPVLSRQRLLTSVSDLSRVFLQTSFRLQERVHPASLEDGERWLQVISMLNQIMDLERLIFLERIPGEQRLREVKALYCSLSDIRERRRDYTRAPYSQALHEKKPLRLEYDFFSSSGKSEAQYLIPLVSGDDVLGFWALGIAPEKIVSAELLDSHLRGFADRIADLLHNRRQRILSSLPTEHGLSYYLRQYDGKAAFRVLEHSIGALEQRMGELEDVLQGLETATILYDLFGRVIQVNRRMQNVSLELGIHPGRMSVLDFLKTVSKVNTETARHYLRYIILKQGKISLPVSPVRGSVRVYVLNMRPLHYHNDQTEHDNGGEDLRLQGILCELSDITEMKRVHILKEQLVERLIFKLRNDLGALMTAVPLLIHKRLTEEKKETVTLLIYDKVEQAVSILEKAQSHLIIDKDVVESGSHPIDGERPLQEAIGIINAVARKKQVNIITHLPKIISLVFASNEELKSVFLESLKLLLGRAENGSGIVIAVEERDNHVTYTFYNKTTDSIPEVSPIPLHSEEFIPLREALQAVANWEGEFNAGEIAHGGLWFKLRLRGFI